ncbi:hypothetical protein BDR05DRAFT_1015909 [Suillus weaverae]|nr:hypothetical protein BDR05DRAFT_1015909 [Suillus weaverae]
MIDPFTSSLTIVHVVKTIAQASALLYGYIASVRDADSACQALLDKLSSIIGVLTTVMEIEKDPSLPDNLRHGELKNLLPNEQESKKLGAISKLKWPFKEKKAAAITERLKGFYRNITTVLAIDSRNMLKEVDRGVKEVNRGVQELKEAQEAHKKVEEHQKLLQWMNPVSCVEKHDASCHQRNPETGGWIFHANEYKTWNTSECTFLWLNGQRSDEAEPQIGEKQESNMEGNLDPLQDLWQQQCVAKLHPTDLGDYPDLVGHLVNLAEDARLRLFVTGRSEPEIQDAFDDLPTVSLKDSAEQMKADICAHITEQLKAQKKLSCLSDVLKKSILEKLLEKAEGMFRWVQCQLDEIMACKRRIDIEAALDNLPAGLYETYDRIIHAIKQRGPSDDQIAWSCLLWLASTFTPLTLDQLNEAMMIEVGQSNLNPDLGVMDPMDIVAACGSLVTYNEKTAVVALSHYSMKSSSTDALCTQEYLISRPDEILKSTSNMHACICKLLITYVLCDFVDEICAKAEHPATLRPWERRDDDANVSKDHPLLSYAILGWKHLGHVSDEDLEVMDALSRLNSEFLRNTKKHQVLAGDKYGFVPRWLRADATLPSLLFIPLEHGKPWMVESLVKQHPDLLDMDIAPGWGSPLIFAIAKRPDCLTILLKTGVRLNKLSSFNPDLYGQCIGDGSYAPILWAAATESEVAVDLVLSQTDLDIPNDVLRIAVEVNKLPSHKFICEFCRRGADVNLIVDGFTPVHYFLYRLSPNDEAQSLPVVKALIEPSCNLSLQDPTARTALHIALDSCLENVVAYLLEQNAGLSAMATLHPDMWSCATNKTWFPNVQAAALAAAQPCTRIKGKVVEATEKSQIVEFSVAVTADCNNPNPICAVVVSVILNGRCQSLQKDIQDSPKDDSRRFDFYFEWDSGQRVSSRLFDYHQEDEVTKMLQQLSEDTDLIGTSLFLQMLEEEWDTKRSFTSVLSYSFIMLAHSLTFFEVVDIRITLALQSSSTIVLQYNEKVKTNTSMADMVNMFSYGQKLQSEERVRKGKKRTDMIMQSRIQPSYIPSVVAQGADG